MIHISTQEAFLSKGIYAADHQYDRDYDHGYQEGQQVQIFIFS